MLLPQKAGRFPIEVPYITVSGNNVSVCVTTEGVFEKLDSETFILTGYIGNASDQVQILENIKETVEWDLETITPLKYFLPPSPSWLQFLRSFDPNRYFLGRFPT